MTKYIKRFFLIAITFIAFTGITRSAEDPNFKEYEMREHINNIISDLPADVNAVPVIAEYLNAQDEAYKLNNISSTTFSAVQIVLLKSQSMLTICTIAGIDSLATFSPSFANNQYFDATLYGGSYQSKLDTFRYTPPDSVLLAVQLTSTVAGSSDSALVRLLGTYDANTTPIAIDTFITTSSTLCQRGATLSGYGFPYWSIDAKAILFQAGTIRAYIWSKKNY